MLTVGLTLLAALMMIRFGVAKDMLEVRQKARICPSCRRRYDGRVCAYCSHG
jgi:recombinational DNA repair protein RecR